MPREYTWVGSENGRGDELDEVRSIVCEICWKAANDNHCVSLTEVLGEYGGSQCFFSPCFV